MKIQNPLNLEKIYWSEGAYVLQSSDPLWPRFFSITLYDGGVGGGGPYSYVKKWNLMLIRSDSGIVMFRMWLTRDSPSELQTTTSKGKSRKNRACGAKIFKHLHLLIISTSQDRFSCRCFSGWLTTGLLIIHARTCDPSDRFGRGAKGTTFDKILSLGYCMMGGVSILC